MKQQLTIAMSIINKVKLPKISNEVTVLQNESLKPEPDVNVIVSCIQRNPKLFTKFLAVASFMTKKEVTSAKQAVSILGTKGVFTVFFSSAIEFSFKSHSDSELMINHAIKMATAMAELAANLKGFPVSDAYLYGLVYNIGYVVLHDYSAQRAKSCYLNSLTYPSKAEQLEMETFGTTNAHIGIYVAKKWRVKNSIYCGILFQNKEIEKCDKGLNKAYELNHLLNVARMVVAETESKRYITNEVKDLAVNSMQHLDLTHLQCARAQQKVKKFTADLQSSNQKMWQESMTESAAY